DGGAVLAALADGGGAVEAERGALLVRAVAADAVPGEERLDVAGVVGRAGGRGDGRQERGDPEAPTSLHHVVRKGGGAWAGQAGDTARRGQTVCFFTIPDWRNPTSENADKVSTRRPTGFTL